MKRYQVLISQCDTDIRAGHSYLVAKRLSGIDAGRVPREWKAPLAKICRRAGLYSMGLTLLGKLIHPPTKTGQAPEATSIELAEYAVLLMRSGALTEAQDYLRGVDISQAPDALLYQAFGHFLRWEFTKAIPHLEKYLTTSISNYARLVGQTNLAYAYVETKQYQFALELLDNLVQTTASEGHQLLEYNCRAYRAQVYVQQNDLSRAKEELASFPQGVASANDHFVVQKWKLILDGLESKRIEPFNRLRDAAEKRRDWAACREADFFSLKVHYSVERALHLYFGSPSLEFREHIVTEFGFVPDSQFYVLGPKAAPCLNLLTGEIDGRTALRAGGMCLQLIGVLLNDFYQPMRIAGLFSALCPNEHFIVSSSPDRVHQIIRRTRRWLESKQIPVAISERDGFYSLHMTGLFSFRVPLIGRQAGLMDAHFENIRKAFSDAPSFSAKNASELLKLSKTTVFRLIKWAIENGKLERLGEANTDARYRFVSTSKVLQDVA
jgi:hypothetical protein